MMSGLQKEIGQNMMRALLLMITMLCCGVAAAQPYYVDAIAGNDSASGRSALTAWQTLTRANTATFVAGDTLYLKRGCVWNNTLLTPHGSGQPGRPFVVSAYGEGNAPVINTAGTATYAVLIFNQEYVEVENLEITNQHPTNSTSTRYGVYVLTSNLGATNHIVLRNLYIHNVNGDPSSKTCGGIFLEVASPMTTPTWFDTLIVEGCEVAEVSPVGIGSTSVWSGRTLTTNSNWYPSVHVNIRNNVIRRTVRNGMIIRVASVPVIEHNILQECAKDSSGNALFVFNCDSAIIQYNEAYLTRFNPGDDDAGGFDGDYRCKNTIMQYNYSHNNEYGGIVVVSDGGGTGTFNDRAIVRYNVLRDNLNHGFRLSGNVTNTLVYNNTIYSHNAAGPLVVIWHKSWGGYCDNTRYYNNIFELQRTGSSFQLNSSTNNVFDYNLFHGIHAAGEPSDAHKLTLDPLFVAPDSVATGWSTALGYRLQAASPAINSGMTVAGHASRDYAGNPVPYAVTAIDRGAFEYQLPSSVAEFSGLTPNVAALADAYPNPFNPSTTIRFSLAQANDVRLVVHDVAGRVVTILASGFHPAGEYSVRFDGSDLASGVYFCTLSSRIFSETKRLLLLK
jgi:hypothetical protein